MDTEPQIMKLNKEIALMATAHELNQPIGIIRAATSAALQDLAEGLFEPHEIEPLLKRILAQSDRLAAIIDNFRKFARGDRTQREEINLNIMVNRVVNQFSVQFQQHNIDLQLETIEPSPIVWANLYQLEEVLINLLTNARDALETTPNAQVIVKTWHNLQGESGFTVSDNGPGVPVEYQPEIFLPFVSSKSTHKGTGLGLYISWCIIKEFDGQLNYQDNPTGGACFTVTLPPMEKVKDGTNV